MVLVRMVPILVHARKRTFSMTKTTISNTICWPFCRTSRKGRLKNTDISRTPGLYYAVVDSDMLGLIEESGKVVKDVKNIEKSVPEFKLLRKCSGTNFLWWCTQAAWAKIFISHKCIFLPAYSQSQADNIQLMTENCKKISKLNISKIKNRL